MGESGRRTFAFGPSHFPTPYSDSVAHAARRELKPKICPVGCVRCAVEARLAVEAIEVGTDELPIGIIDQIGNAAGGIDLIIGTAGGACFRLDDLDAILERLLDDHDAREAGEPYVT